MRILVLGGDGFCGWPTALHLSANNHHVTIVDNFARRAIGRELKAESLTPIQPMNVRLETWKQVSGRTIDFVELDVAGDFDALLSLIQRTRPDTIVHFAEQRAAPYSMKTPLSRRYTVDNNVSATHNVLAAIVASGLDTHLVHLGTMGVYGYDGDGLELPDGYLQVKIPRPDGPDVDRKILYPSNPGSVYHLTKVQDQLMFQFYAKNDGVRITDLHQGIVWGTQTAETRLHESLVNRFDYDGDFGTVLNRFVMQAAIDYPLTVHGSGGQTRAFININDTVCCIRLAVENAPTERGHEPRIMNQMAETHRIRDLARMVADLTGAEIDYVENPRLEAAENDLAAANDGLRSFGWRPIALKAGLLDETIHIAQKYADNCDRSLIPCTSLWLQPVQTAPAKLRPIDAGHAEPEAAQHQPKAA